MGLDMYLLATKNDSNKQELIHSWRKANQIHGWFVDNVQLGEDNCFNYKVENQKLIELYNLCKTALETKDTELLPPTAGFFFGNTEIDELYWQDIRETIDVLDNIIFDKDFDNQEYFYQSSW